MYLLMQDLLYVNRCTYGKNLVWQNVLLIAIAMQFSSDYLFYMEITSRRFEQELQSF